MITELDIYWLTRLDVIVDALRSVTIVFSIFGLAGAAVYFICKPQENEDAKMAVRILKRPVFYLLAIGSFSFIALLLVPTTKEMAAIKAIPMVANNEDVRELGSGVTDLAKQWIEELKPKKEDTK